MKKNGTIRRWDAARGFGFIRNPDSPADVFFHVRDFRGAGGGPPAEGLEVSFEEIHVGGKGPRAMAVQPLRQARAATPPSSARRGTVNRKTDRPVGQRWVLALVPLWAVLIGYGVWLQRLPWWAVAALAIVNLLTLFAYAFDKNAAETGTWRTQESTLHLLALAGGWPAAWLAQQGLRHKSSKASFQATYAVTVVLHCAALAGWVFWLARPSLSSFA